jgi:hypothetical protein
MQLEQGKDRKLPGCFRGFLGTNTRHLSPIGRTYPTVTFNAQEPRRGSRNRIRFRSVPRTMDLRPAACRSEERLIRRFGHWE